MNKIDSAKRWLSRQTVDQPPNPPNGGLQKESGSQKSLKWGGFKRNPDLKSPPNGGPQKESGSQKSPKWGASKSIRILKVPQMGDLGGARKMVDSEIKIIG